MKNENDVLLIEAARAAAYHAAEDVERNTPESRARAAALLYIVEDSLENLSREE